MKNRLEPLVEELYDKFETKVTFIGTEARFEKEANNLSIIYTYDRKSEIEDIIIKHIDLFNKVKQWKSVSN